MRSVLAWGPLDCALVLGLLVLVLVERREQKKTRLLAAARYEATREMFADVMGAVSALRAALGGTVPTAKPADPLPSVERRVVSVTRDDDPVHVRATVEGPPPSGWGEAHPHPDAEPPSTKPSPSRARSRDRSVPTSAPRPVSVDDHPGRALEGGEAGAEAPAARVEGALARLREIDAELGPEGKAAVRARIEAAEDERDKARTRGETAPLPRMDEDEGRPTGEGLGDDEATQIMDGGTELTALGKGSPHQIEVPSSRRTLLGVMPGPVVVPLNTRTAHRIDVLFWTKLTLAAKEGEETAHCEGPQCDGTIAVCTCPCAPCGRRRTLHGEATYELAGPQMAVELAEQARAANKAATISQRIERCWHDKIATRHQAGQDVRHCYAVGCMQEGEGIALCACPCEGCTLVRELLAEAMSEVAGGG